MIGKIIGCDLLSIKEKNELQHHSLLCPALKLLRAILQKKSQFIIQL